MTFNFQATVPLLRSGYDNMASSSRREAQILMILFFDWFQCHEDCTRITTFSWFFSSSLANKHELFPTAAETVVITSSVQEFEVQNCCNGQCIVKLKHLSEFNHVWIPLPLSARYNGCYYELTAEDRFG